MSFSSSFVLLFSEADDVNDDNNNNESRESREYYKVYIKADSSLLSCGPLEFSKTLNNRERAICKPYTITNPKPKRKEGGLFLTACAPLVCDDDDTY